MTESIEQHIALTHSEGAEQTTSGDSVSGQRLFTDGGGQDKEATVLSTPAGASSEASPSSGIPSAVTQSGQRDSTAHQAETSRADRVEPIQQNLEP